MCYCCLKWFVNSLILSLSLRSYHTYVHGMMSVDVTYCFLVRHNHCKLSYDSVAMTATHSYWSSNGVAHEQPRLTHVNLIRIIYHNRTYIYCMYIKRPKTGVTMKYWLVSVHK